jgi:uncharacterized delta-60 repeat protein
LAVAGAVFATVVDRSTGDAERLAGRDAVEAVYARHRVDLTARADSVPQLDDERRKADALEKIWHRTISSEELQAELDRMARESSDPALLREVFEALGNDPERIVEAIVRPALVETRIREAYARDASLHAAQREKLDALVKSVDSLEALAAHGATIAETRWVLEEQVEGAFSLPAAAWERLRERLDATADRRLVEREDRFEVLEVLSWDAGSVTAQVASWPKLPFEAWWSEVRGEFQPRDTTQDRAFRFTLPLTEDREIGVGAPPAIGTWGEPAYFDPRTQRWMAAASDNGAPERRIGEGASWTGAEWIVRGGTTEAGTTSRVERYVPAIDRWLSPLSIDFAQPGKMKEPVEGDAHRPVVAGSTALVPEPAAPTAIPPTIDFEPTPQSTILGGTARFTVMASGDAPLSYQWRKAGVDLSDGGRISGATTDVLTVSSAVGDDAAAYSVVVTNAFGSDTSVDAALTVNTPQGGDVDFGFDSGSAINQSVIAVATQPDGKLLISGAFTFVGSAARGGIARLNPDGTTDFTFGNGFSGANDEVRSIALQPDGRVLIGGYFTTVNGTSRNRIARLHADGSLDTTFLGGLSGANGNVNAIAVQPDGRVLIGGTFTTINGTSRNFIARLNADGSLDTTFLNGLTGADSLVDCVALQSDGRVVIGGGFTTVNGTTRGGIARLNADGSLDTTFLSGLSGANSEVRSISLQSDGRVLLGGHFTTVNGVGRNRIARLNADGSLDTTFLNGISGANSVVNSVVLLSDGRVLIGGDFSTVNGTSRFAIARLNANGSLDTTFLNGVSGPNASVQSVAVQPDGRVLIGGGFSVVNGTNRSRIARLNVDGALDTTFLNDVGGANGNVSDVAVQRDGRVLIGGSFTAVSGTSRNRIARLNWDGTLDVAFPNGLAGANSDVSALALQPDGRILLGGGFTTLNGTSRNRIARLNADGSLDTTFLNGLSGADGAVYSIALQPDGRVLIGGNFTTVNGTSRNRIARLNADGSLDTTFLNGLSGATNRVNSIARQPDGRVLIGGGFTTFNGTSRNFIARLNADGSLDATFLNGLSGPNNWVEAIALQSDDRVLIGGHFTTVNGTSRNFIARLNADGSLDTTFVTNLTGANRFVLAIALQPDGRVLVAGFFTTISGPSRNSIARLNADGSIDTTFLNGLSGAGASGIVSSIAVQSDGRVLLGGVFGGINGVARSHRARLYGSAPVVPTITVEPSAQLSYDGCCAVFHVTASGTPLDYRWRKDGVDLEDGPTVSGAHASTLALTGVTAADQGDYGVVVSNVLGADTSADAALNVVAVPECKVAACDPVLGCILSDASDGTGCSDGDACTSGDTCVAGLCTAGLPSNCDDGNLCTDDSCNMSVGCVYTNNAAPCDDGNACTTDDVCSAGACTAGAPVTCDDGNVCTDDTCNPGIGCVYTNNTAPCDDGDACAAPDTCYEGVCYGSFPVNCNDGNVCTTDTCNFATGCVYTNNTVACNDGNACTAGETCSAGTCAGGAPVTCNDGNVCTDDACNPGIGCVYTNNTALCDDGDACTTGDVCVAGTCTGSGTCSLITFEPTSQSTILGGTARFTVIAAGDPPLTYQWRKDGVALIEGSGVAGSTTDVLTLTGVSSSDAGAYSVVVDSPSGTDTSVDAALTVGTPQGGDVDYGFDAGSVINLPIDVVAIQPDGRVLLGGSFTSVAGAVRGRIARLNADGTTDHTFGNGLAGANSTVYAIAEQPDGRILVGGNFTSFNGVNRGYLARLQPDGSLDTTFLNGLAGPLNLVYAIALQPDGKILIAGEFLTVNGVSRSRIARLNGDGSLDTTFLNGMSGINAWVRTMALQPDGRVLIGGTFTFVNGVSRNRLARLESDGALDTSFLNGSSGADNSIYSIAVQSDGRVVIVGGFSLFNGFSRSRIARLDANGSVDTTFLSGMSGANNQVSAVALQADGRAVLGGSFSAVNGVSRSMVARLNADGSVDTTYLNGLAGANSNVMALALGSDGKAVIGGFFSRFNGEARTRIARLELDGSLDPTFFHGTSGANLIVQSVVRQPDGRILIGGSFSAVHGVNRGSIARLHPGGGLDASFQNGQSGANNAVRAIALQPDGKVLIAGDFTTVNGVGRGYVARLNPDGSLDTGFLNGLAGGNQYVTSIAVQPDGRVLIGGWFTTFNGVARSRIARLHPDGSLDTSFLSGLSGANELVQVIALQPDGRVLIGGWFTTINGVSRNYIARLNVDGTVDTTFLNGLTGPGSGVQTIVVQPDARLLIGGWFTTINGVGRNYVARLNPDGSMDATFLNGLTGPSAQVRTIALQSDGLVLIGGDLTTVNGVSRRRIARLEADGSLDTTFLNGLGGADEFVQTIALQPDGRVLIGGAFGGVNGVDRTYLARLYGSVPTAPVISVEPSAQIAYDACCAVFAVEATGTPADFQWRKDGVDLVDGPGISGAQTATLTLTGVDAADEGDYSVVVSNVLGSDTSADATLTVAPLPSCKVASCHPVLGCVLSNLPDGTACDDGDACTTADACSSGVCLGMPEVVLTFYQDSDGDRYGNAAATTAWCFAPEGYVANALDCDDADATVRPGGIEACDGQRNDCSAPNWPALLDDDVDGTENACETCTDGDADGWGDPGAPGNLCAPDNCPTIPNPDQADPDYDGDGSACDGCPLDPRNDEDEDGVCGDVDNCPQSANAGQADADGDGLGDACDACPNAGSQNNDDLDRDGIPDACDPDVDGDGIPNASDVNDDADAIPDDDGDGVFDPCPDRVTANCDDNCPLDRNPNQRDRDGDGIGDACDPSDDLVQGGSARRSNPPARSQAGDGAVYTFAWEAESGAIAYSIYTGTFAELRSGATGTCYRNRIKTTYTTLDHAPIAGTGYFYLVTPIYVNREGTLGDRSDGTPRPLANACP